MVQIVDKMIIGNKIDTFIGIFPVFPKDEMTVTAKGTVASCATSSY